MFAVHSLRSDGRDGERPNENHVELETRWHWLWVVWNGYENSPVKRYTAKLMTLFIASETIRTRTACTENCSAEPHRYVFWIFFYFLVKHFIGVNWRTSRNPHRTFCTASTQRATRRICTMRNIPHTLTFAYYSIVYRVYYISNDSFNVARLHHLCLCNRILHRTQF